MTQAADTVVRKEIVVEAPIERAFNVFTDRFGDFKPREHNLLGAPITETTFEPRVGGHIYDRAEDGSECRWARIRAYEPPTRVVFSWDIGPTWQLEPDPANTSEVEVRFVRRPRPHQGRTRAPPHRPPWPRLGRRLPRRRQRRRLAAVPHPVRRPPQPVDTRGVPPTAG
jgi:uncharacterized protein YndB with AHSA1/START domain